MDKLPVVLMRFNALAGSMLLLRWYSWRGRQLLLVEEHWLHERLTIVTVAEVLFERIGASRVDARGGMVVGRVVRVCHGAGPLMTA
jgi:hypothetical protein